MKYDGLIFMLLQNNGQQAVIPLSSKETNLLSFKDYVSDDSTIAYFFIDVHEDNSIHSTLRQYTLTPAT